MICEVDIGTQGPPLLTLPHMSDRLWEQHDTTSLTCRRADSGFWDTPIHTRILHYLIRAGFYGVARIGFIRLDHALITALVERWRQETHTFHFPTGESTVTLQDVSVLLGLPVDGSPITGVDHAHPPSMWVKECQRLLGRSPEDKHIRGGRLQIQWLIDNFGELPENATEETVRCFARAYILRLIGGFLMPDKSQNLVKLMFLQFFEDLDCCGAYNWGGAVLATLYRMLCRASRPGDKEIGGPLVLLQIWAWERLPRIAPRRLQDVGPGQGPIQDGDQQLPGGPWGSRWRVGFALDQVPTHVVTVYRDQFNRLTFDEFIWKPYGDSVMELLPNYCTVGSDIWMALVPLICFELVEWHLPQRVLRQFGCVQDIPDCFDTDRRLHSIDRRGHHNTDWAREHAKFITIWESRRERIIPADRSDRDIEYQDNYMQWYRRHTRLLIGNPSHRAASGYQGTGGVIEVLTQRVADDYNLADTAEKALQAITILCPEALHALATIRDRCYDVLCQVNQQQRLTNEPVTLQPSTSRGTCEDQANVSVYTAQQPSASTPLSGNFCSGPQDEMHTQHNNEDLAITNSTSQPIPNLATTDQATLQHVYVSTAPYLSDDAIMEDEGLTQVDRRGDDTEAGGGAVVRGYGGVDFRRDEEGEVRVTVGEEIGGQGEVMLSVGEGIGVGGEGEVEVDAGEDVGGQGGVDDAAQPPFTKDTTQSASVEVPTGGRGGQGGEVEGDGEIELVGKIDGEVDAIRDVRRGRGRKRRGRGRGRGSSWFPMGPPHGEGLSKATQSENVPPKKRTKRPKAQTPSRGSHKKEDSNSI